MDASEIGFSISYERGQALVVGLLGMFGSLLATKFDQRFQWDYQAYLLADVVDRLNLLVWQNTVDGQKGRNVPKPYPRPGSQHAGDDGDYMKLTVDEVKERLSWPREG